MWPRSPFLLFLLLQSVMLKQIHLTCKTVDRPFCGTYQLRDNLWSGEEVFEMSKDDRVFQIVKESNTEEHCVSLRQQIKLCGKPSSAVLVKVKDGQRSVQADYAMVFDTSDCVDDLYSDCESDTTKEPPEVEISGGVVAGPNDFPFMVRLRIQGARGSPGTCGGSLIHNKFFLSALHCFQTEGRFDFRTHCFRRGSINGRCYAVVREHFVDKSDPGEVRINIVNIYNAPSDSSDLVVGELERPVVLDDKAQVVQVSFQPLEAGDFVTTAGWGLFGPTGHLSNVLRRTELEVSVGGKGERVKTKVGKTRSRRYKC